MNHDSLRRAAALAQREQALLARLHQMVEQVRRQVPLATREEAEDMAIGVMSLQAVHRGLLARHDDIGTIDRAAATLARLAPQRSFVQWAGQGAMQEPRRAGSGPAGADDIGGSASKGTPMTPTDPARQTLHAARDQQMLARLREMTEYIQGQFPQASLKEAEDLAMGAMSEQAVRFGLIPQGRDHGTIDRAVATFARLAPGRNALSSLAYWADQIEPGEVRLLREDGMRLGKMPVHKVTPRMALAAVRQNAAALQFINPSFVLENEALREYVVSNWDAWQEGSTGPGGDGGISQLLRDQVGQTQARILELRLKDALATHRQQQASQADTAYPRERN